MRPQTRDGMKLNSGTVNQQRKVLAKEKKQSRKILWGYSFVLFNFIAIFLLSAFAGKISEVVFMRN